MDQESNIRDHLTDLEIKINNLLDGICSVHKDAEDLLDRKPSLQDLLPLVLLAMEGDASYFQFANVLSTLTGEAFETCYKYVRAIDMQLMDAGLDIPSRFAISKSGV
jgi:hypothetical protein